MGKIIRSSIDFLYVKGNRFSAHKLPMIRPPSGTYYLTYDVTLRQLDSGCLGHDFIRDFLSLPHNSPDELFTSLSSTLDSHAPIIIKKSILRLDTSWYTLALLKQKRKLRTLEKKLIKLKSESILALYQLIETTNVLFNITQNHSYLPNCISSFQINRNRTSKDIQRYSH